MLECSNGLYGCRNKKNQLKYLPTLTTYVREVKKVSLSIPNPNASKRGHFMHSHLERTNEPFQMWHQYVNSFYGCECFIEVPMLFLS